MPNRFVGGVLGALLGAAVWVGIAYFKGIEAGYLACLVGLLAGLGVRLLGTEEVAYFDKTQRRMVRKRAPTGGALGGTMAAIIALSFGVGAKYAIWRMTSPVAEEAAAIAGIEDDVMIASLASDVADELEAGGRALSWPEGVTPSEAIAREHFPPEVWSEATNRWNALSAEDKSARTRAMAEELRIVAPAAPGEPTEPASWLSAFGLLDLLWFALAVVTAAKVGSSS